MADHLAQSHVEELGGLRRKARLDIARTPAKRRLRKGHDAKLFGAAKFPDRVIAAIRDNGDFEDTSLETPYQRRS